MGESEKQRYHHFDFPGHTGRISITLENSSFADIEDDELYNIGNILTNFLYGLLLEKRDIRESSLNVFQSILKDSSLLLEDKDLNALLRFSNRAFRFQAHRGQSQTGDGTAGYRCSPYLLSLCCPLARFSWQQAFVPSGL